MGRRRTLRVVEQAVRVAFPDRAAGLMEEVGSWKGTADLLGHAEHLERSGLRIQVVDPGTLPVSPSDRVEAKTIASDEASARDAVTAQVERAVRAHAPEAAEDVLGEVARWRARFEEMAADALRVDAVVRRVSRERGIAEEDS